MMTMLFWHCFILIVHLYSIGECMFKITNTKKIGKLLTITDIDGIPLGTLHLVHASELLNVAFGEYDSSFISYSNYLKQSVACLSGFNQNQLYRTLCWVRKGITDSERDSDLTQAIEYAIQHGYTAVILEDNPSMVA